MKKKRVTTVVLSLIGVGLMLAGLLWWGILPEPAERLQPDTGVAALDNSPQPQVKTSHPEEAVADSPGVNVAENGDPNRIILGVILFNIDNFFETVGQGMEAAAAEDNIEIFFDSANTLETEQNRILEEYIDRQVDVILFSPIDEETVSPPVKVALDNGIRIVCFNGCFRENAYQQAQVSAWYATDQTQLGANTAALVAEWMAAQPFDTLHVGWVGCNDGCKPRVQGFFDTLDELHVNWVLVDGQRGFNEASEVIGVVEASIQKYPEINIVFAENEGTTIGAVQAVQRQGRAGEVFVFGTDISPQIAEMLLADDNILQAVTAQNAHQMGYLAAKAAVELAKGGEKQDVTYVPVDTFQRDQPEKVREYLAK